MIPALLGKKIGMTRVYDGQGRLVPVTVVQAGPCTVTQVKTADGPDGYHAVQLGFGVIKPKNSTQAEMGHAAKAGVATPRFFRESREKRPVDGVALGDTLDVSSFEGVSAVDVVGVSKGKGFAGVMKRHHFGGMSASHGTERMHRHGGSIASHATNRGHSGKPKKGLRMGGRMGGAQVTTINHALLKIDAEAGVLVIMGPLPGPNGGLLMIRKSTRDLPKKDA